jgi:glycosyltransferase involved in cell wall biosynthesis
MLVIDARPTQNEHRHRGIGRYVQGLTGALVASQIDGDVRLLVHGDRPLPDALTALRPIVSRRPHLLRYHGGWLADEVLLPLASHGRWQLFHATDPDAVPDPRLLPLVATMYDLTPRRDPMVWRSMSPDQRLGHSRMVANARRARAVITISHAVRDEILSELRLPRDRVHVVYPGIDVATWQRPEAAPRSGLLFVGAPAPHKNLPGLLEALQQLPPDDRPPLTVAGPWPASHVDAFRRSAQARGVDVNVEAHADDDRLRQLYATSAALVMPSRWEGFGLPVLEAMAAGCPVIISSAAALQEVAGGAAVMVPIGDFDALAGAILRLLGDVEEQGRLTDAGLTRAMEFSWARSVTALRDIYEAALGG